MNNIPAEKFFTKRLIRPNTWIVQQGTSLNATATYVLLGSERALVIDTGEHTCNLRAYVESMTSLPLVVANTHSHFDHTGNNYQFKDCPIYMSVLATKEVKHNIHNYLNPDDFEYDYDVIGVEDGFCIDLGDRTIEAFSLGCHSLTSLCWLDKKYNLLFSGDEVETGQVLLMGNQPEQCIDVYLDNLEKLNALRKQGEIDLICPAHNGSPVDATFLETLIENCRQILAGNFGKEDISSPSFMQNGSPHAKEREKRMQELKRKDPEAFKNFVEPVIRRSEWQGSSIVYDINRIHRN